MKKTDYEVRRHHRIDSGFVMATKQPVLNYSFVMKNSYDESKDLHIVLASNLEDASQKGLPGIMVFRFEDNTSNKRKSTPLVDLKIPMIPLGFDSDSRADISTMINHPKASETAIKNFQKMDKDTKEEKLDMFLDETQEYISFEFGLRYAKARAENDEATMETIKSIYMLDGFDFDLCADVLDKKVKNATDENRMFLRKFKNYLDIRTKYQELFKSIEEYKYHEIDKELDRREIDYSQLSIPEQDTQLEQE